MLGQARNHFGSPLDGLATGCFLLDAFISCFRISGFVFETINFTEEKLTFEIKQCFEVSLQLALRSLLANLNTGCQHETVLPSLTSSFTLPSPHQGTEHQNQRQTPSSYLHQLPAGSQGWAGSVHNHQHSPKETARTCSQRGNTSCRSSLNLCCFKAIRQLPAHWKILNY